MARVLITGMSGAGKTSVLDGLAARGYRTIDTDYDGWTTDEATWDEPRMARALADYDTLAVSGTAENQGAFYDRFEAVVYLYAPLDVLLDRVQRRTNNPYGTSPEQRADIARYVAEVEPLIRRGATVELDARRPLGDLIDDVAALLDGERLQRKPFDAADQH